MYSMLASNKFIPSKLPHEIFFMGCIYICPKVQTNPLIGIHGNVESAKYGYLIVHLEASNCSSSVGYAYFCVSCQIKVTGS